MRGQSDQQSGIYTFLSPEQKVPKGHPLRAIKEHADAVLKEMSPVFNEMYSKMGRPSIPPEVLLKAQLLMAFFSVRSDRLFCEMLDYNILFRWFLDMGLEEASLDATTFSKNRERLLKHDVAQKFFDAVVRQAKKRGLLSDEHFTVDGTLVEAWASMKSFRPKGEDEEDRPRTDDDPGNPTVDFRGEKRSNDTHESTTDPQARLMRKAKGKEAKLSYGAHALMENRNGLLVDLQVEVATGKAERETAIELLKRRRRKGAEPKTVGGDKGFDTGDFVDEAREMGVTPHVAANTARRGGSAIDGRTTRHGGYLVSQRIRKRVEEIFGWLKTIGGLRRTRFKGRKRTQMQAHLAGAAYNLLRIAKLTAVMAAA